MEIVDLLEYSERTQRRAWFECNAASQKCCWIAMYRGKKKPEGACLPYLDVVEESLCFGWIDGRAGTLDDKHHIRRFTPRRKGSGYSQPNIERLIWLDERGMIHPKVRESVEEIINTPFVFPDDIIDAIRQDEVAWENYEKFAEPYKRIRVAYIDAARKRPEEFKKRLDNFIRKTKDNKLIVGYGGIEKYYK